MERAPGSTCPLQPPAYRSMVITEGPRQHVPPQRVEISGGLSRTSWLPGNQVWVLLMLHTSPRCVSVTLCPRRQQHCCLHQPDTLTQAVLAVAGYFLIVRMQQLALNLAFSALLLFAAMPSVYLQSGMSPASSPLLDSFLNV